MLVNVRVFVSRHGEWERTKGTLEDAVMLQRWRSKPTSMGRRNGWCTCCHKSSMHKFALELPVAAVRSFYVAPTSRASLGPPSPAANTRPRPFELRSHSRLCPHGRCGRSSCNRPRRGHQPRRVPPAIVEAVALPDAPFSEAVLHGPWPLSIITSGQRFPNRRSCTEGGGRQRCQKMVSEAPAHPQANRYICKQTGRFDDNDDV